MIIVPEENISMMIEPATPDNMLVVIVLHGKSPSTSVAFGSLGSVTANGTHPAVFVYDNSPRPSDHVPAGITYFHNPGNAGVSRAYNMASVRARELNKAWMLLLDQDTAVTNGYLEELSKATNSYPETALFVPRVYDVRGMLSPFRLRWGRGVRLDDCPGLLSLKRFRFINSGLAVRTSAFIKAEGYDENSPLDFSDFTFAERLKSRMVTDHFRVLEARLKHSFSGTEAASVDSALSRYRFFRQGTYAMSAYVKRAFVLYRLSALLRALRLTVKYKDLRFLMLFIHPDT